MSDLREVPTLDRVAEDPGAAAGLPRDVLLGLQNRAICALAALGGQLIAALNGSGERPVDRLVGVEEAARLLGRSTDWLYRHGRKLPFVVQEGKGAKLRFSTEGIARYIRERAGLTG
jgi:hypothetical protein